MAGSVAQSTYERLREMLLAGEIAAGDRLVNRTLAAELGVSVIPVREAIQRLASEGLVEHIPGAGAYARKLDRREISQLYSFREQLEIYAAREAAAHIRSYQLDQLEQVCEEFGALLNQIDQAQEQLATHDIVKRWLVLDAAFHEVLIEAADNPWLQKATSDLKMLSRVVSSKPRHLSLEVATRTHDQHLQLIGAIRAGNADAAGDIMRGHIQSAVAFVLQHFEG